MDDALLNVAKQELSQKNDRKRKYSAATDFAEAPQHNNNGDVVNEVVEHQGEKRKHLESDVACGAPARKYRELASLPFTLEDFSDEILVEIFKYLDTWTLLGLMNLNKRLHVLLLDSRFWHKIDLIKEPLPLGILEDYLDRTNKKTHTIKLCGPGPSQLDSEIKQFNKTLSDAFIMRCRQLLDLELCGVTIDFRNLNFVDFPKTLKRIILNNCNVCMPESARNLFAGIETHLTEVEELGIEENNWFDPYYLMALSKMPALRKLSLRGCQQLADFVAYGSMAARFGFKKLEYLDFRFTPISNSDLQCFNAVKDLKVLLLDCPPTIPKDEASSSSFSMSTFSSSPPPPPSIVAAINTETYSVTSVTQPTTTASGAQGTITATILDAFPTASTSTTAATLRAITSAAAAACSTGPPNSLPPSTTTISNPRYVRRSKSCSRTTSATTATTTASLPVIASTSAAAAAATATTATSTSTSTASSSSASSSPSLTWQHLASGSRSVPNPLHRSTRTTNATGTALQQPAAAAVPEAAAHNNILPAVQNRICIRPDRYIVMDIEDRHRSIIIQSSQPRHLGAGPAGAGAAAGGAQAAADFGAGPGHNNEIENVINHPLFWNLVNPLGRGVGVVRRSIFDHDTNSDFNRCRATRARPRPSVTDRGICCFGRAENPVEPGVILIRIGNRPNQNSFTRLCVRNYQLVTDISLAHLVQCSPHLTYLDVSGTSVTAAAVERFKRLKPNCTVVADHLTADAAADIAGGEPGDDADDERKSNGKGDAAGDGKPAADANGNGTAKH